MLIASLKFISCNEKICDHSLCLVPRDKCRKVYTRGLSERDKRQVRTNPGCYILSSSYCPWPGPGLPQQAEVRPGPGAHQAARGLRHAGAQLGRGAGLGGAGTRRHLQVGSRLQHLQEAAEVAQCGPEPLPELQVSLYFYFDLIPI